MKSTSFWVVRFLTVFAATTLLLLGVYLFKGADLQPALREAAMWALISTSIFIAGRYYNASRGKACALCRDTVEEEAGQA